jgi:hypothetical protein
MIVRLLSTKQMTVVTGLLSTIIVVKSALTRGFNASGGGWMWSRKWSLSHRSKNGGGGGVQAAKRRRQEGVELRELGGQLGEWHGVRPWCHWQVIRMASNTRSRIVGIIRSTRMDQSDTANLKGAHRRFSIAFSGVLYVSMCLICFAFA